MKLVTRHYYSARRNRYGNCKGKLFWNVEEKEKVDKREVGISKWLLQVMFIKGGRKRKRFSD